MNIATEAYTELLDGHLRQMTLGLNRFTDAQWNWRPFPTTPCAKQLAENTLEWLICDRQHINVPDALFHDELPAMPADRKAIIGCIEAERTEWRNLLESLHLEQLAAPRRQFNHPGANNQDVRWFILHALQNTIYNHGQLATLFLSLQPEGVGPYEAAMPREYYAALLKGWNSQSKSQVE